MAKTEIFDQLTSLLDALNLNEFVVVDVETTGLEPDVAELIEIAAVRFEKGQEVKSFSSLIKPGHPIPLNISKLTGIYDADVKTAPDVSIVLQEFATFLGESVLVGHNVRFDLNFLEVNAARLAEDEAYLKSRRSGQYSYFPNLFYDTFELSKIFNPVNKSFSLVEMCRYYSIKQKKAHRAESDARATGFLFLKLIDQGAKLGEKTLHEMADLMQPTNDPLKELFIAYLAWFKEQEAFVEPDFSGFWSFIANHYNIIGKTDRMEPDFSDSGSDSIDVQDVLDVFSNKGALANGFPNYETRIPQLEMSEAVTGALNNGHFLTVEAGTGTGKSLAYLVPAIKYAVNNRQYGQRIIISTNTKNLQEQLFYKDIPRLSAVMDEDFSGVLLKGKSNYLCLDRFSANLVDQQQRLSVFERKSVLPLITWSKITQTGDIAENNGFQVERNGNIWSRFIAENNYCPGRKCSFYGDCYLMRARNSARKADIVLVNHSLLFSDLVTDNIVLGSYDNVIFDEAHNIEKTATEYLGMELNFWIVRRLAHKIHRKDNRETGLVIQFRKNIAKSSMTDDEKESFLRQAEEAQNLATELVEASDLFFRDLTRHLVDFRNREESRYQTRIRFDRAHPIHDFLVKNIDPLYNAVDRLAKAIDKWGYDLNTIDEALFPFQEQTKQELISAFTMAGAIKETIYYFKEIDVENMVNWFELPIKEDSIDTLLRSVPLNVASILEEMLFDNLRSVIFASATLAINRSFKYFAGRVGITNVAQNRKNSFIAGSPFAFKELVKVMVTGFLPDPRNDQYGPQLFEFIQKMRTHVQKGTLILFTSYSLLNQVYENLKFHFDAENQLLLAQGKDGSRTSIIQRFREDKHSVLMGTDSFWEGVDVPGEALQILMMTKLPFEVPSDPVIAARMQEIERKGGNSFFDFSIPEAIIKFRQGFGRLVRTQSDRGLVILTDVRLAKMRYGKQFLDSLPVKADIYDDEELFVNDLNTWFGNHETNS